MPGVNPIVEKVVADVAREGWSAIGVMATVDTPPGFVPFTYSIGLTETWDFPEIIVTHIPADTAHSLIVSVVDLLKEGEVPATDGSDVPRVIRDYPVRFQEVGVEHFNAARAYYADQPFDGVLMLWPDAERRFPGDPGYTGPDQQPRPEDS